MKLLYLIKPAILLLIATSFNMLSLKAQETKNISINNFSGVSVSAGIELFLTQGTAEKAKIVAKEDVIDQVVIEKNGTEVQVKWKENKSFFGNSWKNRSAKVYISYKKLNSITASSGSSIKTENVLKTDHLEAKASSGANINAQLSCTDLQLQTSSGAAASLTGSASNMVVKSSSGASINALELTADYARVTASSGADVKVNVNKGLEATSSSGGSIRYKGNADLKNNSSSRSGEVRKIN